jgi:hypothetical protein
MGLHFGGRSVVPLPSIADRKADGWRLTAYGSEGSQ